MHSDLPINLEYQECLNELVRKSSFRDRSDILDTTYHLGRIAGYFQTHQRQN